MFPPSPVHILRGHGTQINALFFSVDNERLYSGDSAGQVIATSTRSLRPFTSWRAHSDGILGIEEWNDSVITHGRDHKLLFWTRILEPAFLTETATTPALPLPILKFSMDVNALNYCRFSLLPECEGGSRALLALPNLIDSSLADVWVIPSADRLHAAVGKTEKTLSMRDGRGPDKTAPGIIMSLHLFRAINQRQPRLLLAYENGSISLFVHTEATEKSIEGRGWDSLWTVKSHAESVMAMVVGRDNLTAFTVSADHLLCRYRLEDKHSDASRLTIHRTKYPGNGALAIRMDGRIVAVGGWDGKVRLYSTKTFKPLGTLAYHKEGCYAIAFACDMNKSELSQDKKDDTDDADDREERWRWLATGGKDARVSIWQLMDFDRK
ncbi:WD40 repeat-like protein [Ramaria rubella]|nr:WD40 repeat-like protein [Ramaria rubella]